MWACEETVVSLISESIALLGALGVMVAGYLLAKPILNEPSFELNWRTFSRFLRSAPGVVLVVYGTYLVSEVVSALAGFDPLWRYLNSAAESGARD